MSRLHLILARARNGVIGDQGRLPWHLPEDLAYFKRTTIGHAVVMGRRTWDSIGRPLPGRLNLVLTRDPRWRADGAEAVHNLDEAIARARAWESGVGPGGPDVFVIGGAQLYALALARSDLVSVHLTRIDADFAGDTCIAELDPGRWRECAREHFPAGGVRPFAFDIIRYEPASPQAAHPEKEEHDAQ